MKSLKKIGLLALISLLCITMLAACAPKNEAPQSQFTGEPTNRLEEILKRGTLIVATSPDFAPLEFIDSTKTGQEQYVGSDILMAQYIAEQLGVKLEIEAMDFSAVLSSVSLGTADLAISGFGWREDRQVSFELSNGFNKTGEAGCHGFLINAEDKDTYKTLEDLAGATIAAQVSSLQEGYAKDQIPTAKLELVTALDIGVMMLKTGKVDALTTACDQVNGYASANPGFIKADAEFVLDFNSKTDGNVVAVKKGETELVTKVNEIIEEINDKGLYEQWSQEAKVLAKTLGIEFEGSDEITVNQKEKGIVEVFQENYMIFFEGLWGTLKLAAITVLFGTLIGFLLAMIQLSKSKLLRFLAATYVEVLRGTPILVQLYIFYFFIPEAFPALNLSKYLCVVIALVFNSSAYVAEIIRSGIQAVDKGQTEAAKSLGMSNVHMMVRIIFPQAIKNILPALCNEFIMMIKETSLASVFFIGELMYTKTLLQSTKFYTWQPLFIIAMIYFVVTFTLSKVVKVIEKRMSVSD